MPEGIDGGRPEARESTVRHPLSSGAELFGLVAAWLREWQPAAPIVELVVEAPELEAAGQRQLRLWMGGDGSAEEVRAALERLQERWGETMALGVHARLPCFSLARHRYELVAR